MRCRPSLSQSLSLSPTPQPASCRGSRSVVIDVWFNWGASTASGKDGTGLRLVREIILALARTLLPSRLPQSLLLEICANLLHYTMAQMAANFMRCCRFFSPVAVAVVH